jgi:phospholipid/cholesterol/gamma-HCH transport system substrate-binding protein/paraquat-inducible protein B
MMTDNQNYFRLGLFVLVTLTLLVVILFILGGRSLFQPTFTFETYFDQSVAGLEVGAPVKFRGVPLGEVIEIVASPAAYEGDIPIGKRKAYIVVRAKISASKAQTEQYEKEVTEYVKRGLRAQTQLAGITGQQYLALDNFDPEKYPALEFNWTPKYPYIPSAPSLTSEIIANAQTFLASLNEADVKALSQNLNTLLLNVNRKLDQLPVAALSTEAENLLKDARGTIDRVDRVIAGAPIDDTVRNLSSTAARLDKLLADAGLKRTVDNTAEITERLRKIAETGEFNRIVKKLDETIQRFDALLGENQYDVRVIIQNLRVTADNLRTLSETAKRYPAGLLIGAPPEKVELPKESK